MAAIREQIKSHKAAQQKKNKAPEPKLQERINVVQPDGKPVSKPGAAIDEITEYEQMMATPQKATEAKAAPKTQAKTQAQTQAKPQVKPTSKNAVTYDRKKKLGESANIPGQKTPQRKKANPFMQAIREEMVAAYPELGDYTVVSLAELVKRLIGKLRTGMAKK